MSLTEQHKHKIRVCSVCGKPTIGRRQTCSEECSKEAIRAGAHHSGQVMTETIRVRELAFIDRFNNKYLDLFVYVSGYTGSDSKIVCRCVKCGELKAIGARCVRGTYVAVCDICRRTEEASLKQELDRAIKEQSILTKKQQQEKRALRLQQQEAERQAARTITIECAQCGDLFTTTSKRIKCCKPLCARQYNDRTKETKRRMRAQDAGQIDWTITLDKLIKRDNGKCHICGVRIDKSDFYAREDGTIISGNMYPSIDHVQAIVNGGLHQWHNVRLAHRICNSIKSDKNIYINKDGQMQLCI